MADTIPFDTLRHALVIKLRHHGDVLLTSPVLSALKAQAPQCEVDALVYSDTIQMLEGHPALDRIHTIDRRWKQLGIIGQAAAEWRLLKQLRARQYDLVIHLTEHWRGAWISRLTGARWRVAPVVRARHKLWSNSFTHLVSEPRAGGRHVVESNLDALRRIGIHPSVEGRALTLVPGEAAEARVDALLSSHGLAGKEFVHVHPASRWLFKCWPAEQMAALVDSLQAAGWPVVLTGAPDPAEQLYVEDILRRLVRPQPANLAGLLSLKELAALTARARLFVGVDSAPMHIAAAMGTPVVALFGPSGEKLWGPWGTPRHGEHKVIASVVHGCRPCGIDGCGGGKISDCLVTLPVERVLKAVNESLS